MSHWRGPSYRPGGREAERRREPRTAVHDINVESPVVEAVLVDASDSGLGVEVARQLRIGVLYPFRLSRGAEAVEIYAVARWCAASGDAVYRAGLSLARWEPLPAWLVGAG